MSNKPLITIQVPEGSYILLAEEMGLVIRAMNKYHGLVNHDIVVFGAQEDIFKKELEESIKERESIHALMRKMGGG